MISDKKHRGITKPYYGYTKKIVNRYESPGISIINMKHSSNTNITKNSKFHQKLRPTKLTARNKRDKDLRNRWESG